jgi:hypothetical protein
MFVLQQFLHCYFRLCCCGNMFTAPLLSNGCHFLFHYSGFQLSCYSVSHLSQFVIYYFFIVCCVFPFEHPWTILISFGCSILLKPVDYLYLGNLCWSFFHDTLTLPGFFLIVVWSACSNIFSCSWIVGLICWGSARHYYAMHKFLN